MRKVLILGTGKIGSLISVLLQSSADYQVTVADRNADSPELARVLTQFPDLPVHTLDVSDEKALKALCCELQPEAIISSLPYFCTVPVAQVARALQIHYFDLTEDLVITHEVGALAEGARVAFVPQCGLAPGFISVVANELMHDFDRLDTVKLRVGALPINANNILQYALTWSTEGLINEYGNACEAIIDGELKEVLPLSNLETIQIDGLSYEAFNTSGGLGSLAHSYLGKVDRLSYKTIRYPGHCQKLRFLMNDLKLNDDRDTLKRILEHAVPKTYQDVVIIYVSVTGQKNGELVETNYMKKIYPATIAELSWSAIQVTTAASCCAVADLVLNDSDDYHGLVLQESFSLSDFLENRFGAYYK